MVQYFISKDLSQKLGINVAKWKRWSREFLPPDPLGGYQSGYARQYSIDDAFRVFLGGYLVTELNLPIPESRNVLAYLEEWLAEKGFLSLRDPMVDQNSQETPFVEEYVISVIDGKEKNTSRYRIKAILSRTCTNLNGVPILQEKYQEKSLATQNELNEGDFECVLTVKTLFITRLLKQFVKLMELPDGTFKMLG
jgi:hypothetical protein